MDPLTHTAVGVFLSRAGLNRLTPRATPILILAANAPDIDIVAAAFSSLDYLHYHRHITHALAAMPVMAIAPVLLVRALGRKPVRWLGGFVAAMAAVASHLALDYTNTYGIRLLLPFSGEWFRLDATNVIDLWIWVAMLLGLAVPFLSRLVGSEIASRDPVTKNHGRASAILALVFLAVYDFGRGVLHSRAEGVLESRLYDHEAPARVLALPDLANPLQWRGVVETGNFFAVQDLDLREEFDPTEAAVFSKPEYEPALDAARRAPEIREFLRFSQAPLWRVTPAPEPEGGRLVEVFDMRFGTPRSPGFMASAVVDPAMRVVSASFRFGRPRSR